MMEQGISRFRRRVDAHFGGRPGRGARYSSDLRAEALSLAREATSQGVSLGALERRLGLGSGTLRRWLSASSGERQPMRAVELVSDPSESAQLTEQDRSLILVTVAGHRIEGLSLEEVSRLLEVLG